MATADQRFEADKKFAYRALQDARQYVTDFDRSGSKAEALYERLARASRMMRPWSTDGTGAQAKKAIEYLEEINSILSAKIGPAARREFSEQGGTRHHAAKKKSPAQLQREIDEVLAEPRAQSPYSVHSPEWERDRLVRKLSQEKARLEQGASSSKPGATKRASRPAGGSRVAHATKKDFDWSSFTDGAAFAFWASPYMSEVESLYEDAREKQSAGDSRAAQALEAAHDKLSPGPGGRWESVMPKTPPAAYAVAKKFVKAVRDQLTDEQLDEIASKFSAEEAGYRGAMQSQGEGIGWFDEGVKADPPRGFDWDPKIQNAIYTAIRRQAREAGIKLPR